MPILPHGSFRMTKMLRRCLALVIGTTAGALAVTHPLWADELIMKNGDRLTGEVVGRSGDNLKFKTSYAGIITVKWGEIKTVHADQPMTLQLDNQRVVKSRSVTNREDDFLVVEEEVNQQEMVMEQGALTSINPQLWTLGEGYQFTGLVNLAAEYERGNNHTDEIDADGKVLYRRKHHRLRGNFTLERDRKNNESTKNKLRFRTSYDYFPAKPWEWGFKIPKRYYGATVLAERDEFADLTLRLGAGPYAGYQFYEGHDMNLLAEMGFLHVHEEFKNDEDNNYWAPGWLIDFDKFLLRDKVQFYHRQLGYRGVIGSDKLVWDGTTGFRVPLWAGLLASAELELEYDGEPAGDADKLDTTYRLKIGYGW